MYIPETVVTNEDLTRFIDTSDAWIREKIGIHERRVAAKSELPSDFCTHAAEEALKNACLAADDMDLIIVALSGPDVSTPATAAIVQGKIGATKASVFDIRNGCQGFMTALITASKFISDGTYKKILVIGACSHGTVLSTFKWRERTKAVFFGDGAGAVVLEACPLGEGLLSSHMGNDINMTHILHLPFGGISSLREGSGYEDTFLGSRMEGKEIFDFTVREVPKTIRLSLERANLTTSDVDFIILHQANENIITAIMEKLEVPLEKTLINIHHYGNTSEASIPIALHEALQGKKIKKGDRVVLCGFGAGLGWGTVLFRW